MLNRTTEGRIAVILDGGQGRVFAAVHERRGPELTTLKAPWDATPEEAESLLETGGFAAAFVRGRPPGFERLEAVGAVAWEAPLAAAAGELARAGHGGALEPLYARAPAIRPRPGRGP